MITVTYLGESYECVTALKGADYIHLLDSEGCMVAAFDGVSDFSDFAITGGDWTTPTPEQDCYLAVVKEDGTIGKGGHRCCDIPTETVDIDETPIKDSKNPISSGGVYEELEKDVLLVKLSGDMLLAEPIVLNNDGTLVRVTPPNEISLYGKKIEIEYAIRNVGSESQSTHPHRFVTIRVKSSQYYYLEPYKHIVAKDPYTGHLLYVDVVGFDSDLCISVSEDEASIFEIVIMQIRVIPEVRYETDS